MKLIVIYFLVKCKLNSYIQFSQFNQKCFFDFSKIKSLEWPLVKEEIDAIEDNGVNGLIKRKMDLIFTFMLINTNETCYSESYSKCDFRRGRRSSGNHCSCENINNWEISK